MRPGGILAVKWSNLGACERDHSEQRLAIEPAGSRRINKQRKRSVESAKHSGRSLGAGTTGPFSFLTAQSVRRPDAPSGKATNECSFERERVLEHARPRALALLHLGSARPADSSSSG